MSAVRARTSQGNRAGRSCRIEEKSAALSSDFGIKMLRAKFPELADEILARLGTYTRGPRKDLPRGYVTWTKVVEGGWHYGTGRVMYPGTQDWDVRKSADLRDASIPGAIIHERETAEREAKAAEWDAMSETEKELHRARLARRAAFRCLREDDDREAFHRCMARARKLVRDVRSRPVLTGPTD